MKIRNLILAASALLSVNALEARPMGDSHPPRPSMISEVIQENADELGIADATLDKIVQLDKAGIPQRKKLHQELDAERKQLEALMNADKPNKAAILDQLEMVGAAHQALKVAEVSNMLDIRALLTVDQWKAVREYLPRRPGPDERHRQGGPGERGGNGPQGMRGHGGPGGGPNGGPDGGRGGPGGGPDDL